MENNTEELSNPVEPTIIIEEEKEPILENDVVFEEVKDDDEEKEQLVEVKDDDVNVLSGDNKVDVEIEPDVKSNKLYLQFCSCSFILNCFNKK
jgi:hypothetical protein